MLTATRLNTFLFFVLALAIWTGAAVHETIASHWGWYAAPVSHVRGAVTSPGTINAWPFTTMLLVLGTVAAGIVFSGYRGPARWQVLMILGTTLVTLAATFVYFVPTLIRFADHQSLSDAEIISMSMSWIGANIVRVFVLLALVVSSLVALRRLA